MGITTIDANGVPFDDDWDLDMAMLGVPAPATEPGEKEPETVRRDKLAPRCQSGEYTVIYDGEPAATQELPGVARLTEARKVCMQHGIGARLYDPNTGAWEFSIGRNGALARVRPEERGGMP